eukprot:jgi/Bigna1/73435/fgenesh1_pg.24_\
MASESLESLWNWWDFLPPTLCSSLRFDALGHGKSPFDAEGKGHVDWKWEGVGDTMIRLGEAAAATVTTTMMMKTTAGKSSSSSTASAPRLSKYIVGGASMGAASALWAATTHPGEVSGIVMVIPPTCFRSRKGRRTKIRDVISRGGKAFYRAKGKLIRPIFACHSSDNNVMTGALESDFPPLKALENVKVRKIPMLVCGWDCDDSTHPMATILLLEKLFPHARICIAKSLGQVLKEWPVEITNFVVNVTQK